MPKKFHILLIDDDETLLGLTQNAAKSSFPEAVFNQLTSINDAKNYFTSSPTNRPALILLDIDFHAKENGFDLLTLFRADRRSAVLPIIMLTNSHVPTDVLSAYNSGVSSFTSKPTSMAEWRDYFRVLRTYWLETVTLPPD